MQHFKLFSLPLKLYLTYKINYDLKGYESEVNMNKKTISEYKKNREYPIQVIVKDIYGVERIIPINDNAKTFTRLTGRKTLKRSDINEIKLLGFDIEILPTVSDLRIEAV